MGQAFPRSRRFWAVVVAFAVGALPTLTLNGMLVLGRGSWATPGADFAILLGVVAIPVLVVALPFLGARRTRRGATTVVLTSLVLVCATGLGLSGGHRLRILALDHAARRAEPLVEAITRFEKDNARPPRTLQELMPHYLERIPQGLPPLELVSGDAVEQQYPGNSWALHASVGMGALDFDELIYLPRQDYEGQGAVVRLGGWAYVRD